MKGLGTRIKFLRKQRKMTLVEMSKKTDLDQATLSRMENEKMVGTLDSHMRIAAALGLRLPQLYDEVTQKLEAVKEKAIRQKVETFSHSSGAVSELLTSGILQKKMMPVLLRIKPKGFTEPEEHLAISERFVYLLKGQVLVKIGDEEKILTPGDSLYFDASNPHFFKNTGKIEAELLSVVTPTSL